MKEQADIHRTAYELNIGDWVYLKRQPFGQHQIAQRKYQKISKRYGPFRISQKISSIAYKLEFLPNSKIHLVFYISLLKPHKASSPTQRTDIPETPDNHPLLQHRVNTG